MPAIGYILNTYVCTHHEFILLLNNFVIKQSAQNENI